MPFFPWTLHTSLIYSSFSRSTSLFCFLVTVREESPSLYSWLSHLGLASRTTVYEGALSTSTAGMLIADWADAGQASLAAATAVKGMVWLLRIPVPSSCGVSPSGWFCTSLHGWRRPDERCGAMPDGQQQVSTKQRGKFSSSIFRSFFLGPHSN